MVRRRGLYKSVKKGLIMNALVKGDAQRKLDNYRNYAYRYTIRRQPLLENYRHRILYRRELKPKLDLVKPDPLGMNVTKIVDHDIRRQYNVGDQCIYTLLQFKIQVETKYKSLQTKLVDFFIEALSLNVHRRHIDQII